MRFLLLLIILLSFISPIFAQQMVLGIEANGPDEATLKAYEWRKVNVYEKYYPQAGFKVVLLNQASKQNVLEALNQHAITHITGCGHGSSTEYTGHRMWQIFNSNDKQTLDFLAGKQVYLLSCQTAQKLGPAMINSGVATYMGYEPNFYFTYKSFDHFMEAAAVIDRSFCENKKSAQAYQDTISKFDEKIALVADQEPGAVRFLIVDRDGLRSLPDSFEKKSNNLPISVSNNTLFAMDPSTRKFITRTQFENSKNRTISYDSMDDEMYRDLVITSYEREARDFEVGILSIGKFHRDQIIKEIRQNTEIGQRFLELERQFLTQLRREWWEETVPLNSTKDGKLRAEGSFESPTELLRSVIVRWRGTPDTFANVKITVNGRVVFDQEALSYEEYNIFEEIEIGNNTFAVEASGGPADTEVEVIFANCGCGD